MIYSFNNDYSESACPKVLQSYALLNKKQFDGYGLDEISFEVQDTFKKLLGRNDVDIHFMTGGTITNLTFLAASLKPYECVIAPSSAHINVHETGAIEATGHKIYTCPSKDGKIRPQDIENCVLYHCDEHMVKPKIVFISNSTEVGTVYSKQELEDLKKMCEKHNLYLYLDGARLSNALVYKKANLTLKDCANLTDAFYFGGTKNGALFGEMLVIINPKLKENFRYMIKQRGGLLAKGFATSIQFKALLEDDLYLKNATKANKRAQEIKRGLQKLGYKFAFNSPTNQIFPIFPDALISKLQKDFLFMVMQEYPNNCHSVRLVCSWSTPKDAVNQFLEYVSKYSK